MNEIPTKTETNRPVVTFDRYLAIRGCTSMLVLVFSVIALGTSLVGLIADLSPLPILLFWTGGTFFIVFCFIPFMFTLLKDMVNGD